MGGKYKITDDKWSTEKYFWIFWSPNNVYDVTTLKPLECLLQIGILGTSRLRWTGIINFQPEDHIFYYSGHEK